MEGRKTPKVTQTLDVETRTKKETPLDRKFQARIRAQKEKEILKLASFTGGEGA